MATRSARGGAAGWWRKNEPASVLRGECAAGMSGREEPVSGAGRRDAVRPAARRAVLWIVQDGVLAGPGAAQVLPYLDGLARRGWRPALLSVEKDHHLADAPRRGAVARRLAAAGVPWTALPFGRGPAGPRTAWQMTRLVAAARGLARRSGAALVHARSCLPALAAAATGRPFVFDMRGFWAEEKVDAGRWTRDGAAHRIGTRLESALLTRAAGVVVLARAALPLLPPLARPAVVVPTAVDLARFRPGLPPPAGGESLAGRTVYAAAGALSGWYLGGETLDLLARALARDPSGHALVLSEEGASQAARGLVARGVDPARVTALGVPPPEVPRWFAACAAGLMLVRPARSKRGSAPTKVGEFLACGVPVLVTAGIGDCDDLVGGTRTGVVVTETTPAGYDRALSALDALRAEGGALAARCRRTAEERLSLSAAVAAYAGLYETVSRNRC